MSTSNLYLNGEIFNPDNLSTVNCLRRALTEPSGIYGAAYFASDGANYFFLGVPDNPENTGACLLSLSVNYGDILNQGVGQNSWPCMETFRIFGAPDSPSVELVEENPFAKSPALPKDFWGSTSKQLISVLQNALDLSQPENVPEISRIHH